MRLSHDDQMRRTRAALAPVQLTPAYINKARAPTPQTLALNAKWRRRAAGSVKAFLATTATIRRLSQKGG